ncbi:MAG: hypothetical protein OHK0012_26950 [Synechococcales cyanobacterium]
MEPPPATVAKTEINHPIQPATEPMQYRAIGVVPGRYLASEDQFTKGILLTTDGIPVDAVLLGKVMNYVRKHTQSDQDYLWVVYPRTRENPPGLHLQIVGVWGEVGIPQEGVIPDEFSIRGEILYHDPRLPPAEAYIVVKIRIQTPPSTEPEGKVRPRFFKLRLAGSLPSTGRATQDFWDLRVQRQGYHLVIVDGQRIGTVMRRPRPKRASSSRPSALTPASDEPPPPKPVRKRHIPS